MANLSKIGRGTTIVGNVRGSGDLEIDGHIEGTLEIDGEVTLSEGARVKSALRVSSAVVRGAVAGDITARDAIVLEEGARVVGDLSAPSIGIRPGALLRGHVSTDASLGRTERKATAQRPAVQSETHTSRAVAPPRAATPSQSSSKRAAPVEAKAEPVRAESPTPHRPSGAEKRTLVEPVASPLTRSAPREAPAPVMPALQKGAKGALKKKGAR